MTEPKTEPKKEEPKETLRNQVIVAFIQSFVFAGLLLLFGFWLNRDLEKYKKTLGDDTEKLKMVMQLNEPLAQQRRSAYLDIQKAAHTLSHVLEVYYFGTESNEVWSHRLLSLEDDMGIGSGSSGGSIVGKQDVTTALGAVISLRERNGDVSSASINTAADDFLETVMQDLKNVERKQNQTEAFNVAARMRVKDALSHLDGAINQALRLGDLPIK
jgi:hypothetical protein